MKKIFAIFEGYGDHCGFQADSLEELQKEMEAQGVEDFNDYTFFEGEVEQFDVEQKLVKKVKLIKAK